MQHSFEIGPAAWKLIVGVAGAVVSLRFVQGSWVEKTFMVVGGSAVSYFLTPFVVEAFNLNTAKAAESAEGIVGFLLGLFGMTLVTKVHEGLQSISAAEVVKTILDRFRSR